MVNDDAEKKAAAGEQKEAGTQELKKPVFAQAPEVAELTDSLRRLQAEFENYKKRVEREKADAAKLANEGLLAELLTILDDFERVPTAEIKDDKVRKGVEMIAGNFRKILEGEGVRPIPAEGMLDPHRHEALMWVEHGDMPEGRIVGVLQKGYSLNGRILRPARVSVSKRPEKAGDTDKKEGGPGSKADKKEGNK